jgi:hypothetical protein
MPWITFKADRWVLWQGFSRTVDALDLNSKSRMALATVSPQSQGKKI